VSQLFLQVLGQLEELAVQLVRVGLVHVFGPGVRGRSDSPLLVAFAVCGLTTGPTAVLGGAAAAAVVA
jgi:hypothetical protein